MFHKGAKLGFNVATTSDRESPLKGASMVRLLPFYAFHHSIALYIGACPLFSLTKTLSVLFRNFALIWKTFFLSKRPFWQFQVLISAICCVVSRL